MRASWLFISREDALDEKQRKSVERIRQGHPDLEVAYQLGQEFRLMLAERRARDLDTWLIQAEQSGLPKFKKMAKGIRLDYAAGNRGVFFRVESGSGRSAGQLLKASETDRVRASQFRSPAASRSLPSVEATSSLCISLLSGGSHCAPFYREPAC
jgi:hypothetical protein